MDDSDNRREGGMTNAGPRSLADDDMSLGGGATYGGRSVGPSSEVSLGGGATLGDKPGEQETVIDDIEVVDLEARYRVEGTLGRGGMGEVLLAVDTRLDRKVAIKRILGEAARGKTALERFRNEAKALAKLNHPNVVTIYDSGYAKDGPFLVMEYVEGRSLLDRCRDGAMPEEEAVDLICQLCDGLATAHDSGIVHRDIKPANVLLTKSGVPKLTDFGLVKTEASNHQMTIAGAVLGTPDFMPPEQRRDAAEVDVRSDLWSLAATLYQMVTGRSPKVIRLHELPQSLQSILGRALEDEKDARYQSASDFRDALRQPKNGSTPAGFSQPSVATDALEEGQCKACGAVTSDLTKKFCRNPACGASLRINCLKCESSIPVWDGVCGECGGNQKQIFSQKQADFEKACQQAKLDTAELKFGTAKALLRPWLEVDQRFDEMKSHSAVLLSEIENAEKLAKEHRDSRIAEAEKHLSAKDYDAAIVALEAIPARMASAESNVLLESARICAKELQALVEQIKSALKEKKYAGLRPKVQRALELTGARADLQKLDKDLFEREQRQAAVLCKAKTNAAAFAADGQYAEAAKVLESLGKEFSDDVFADLQRYHLQDHESRSLRSEIKRLWEAKAFIPLLTAIDKARELQPADQNLIKLRKKVFSLLSERREKLEAANRQAERYANLGEFGQAIEVYELLGVEYTSDVADQIRYYRDLHKNANKLLRRLEQLGGSKTGSTERIAILEECIALMPSREDLVRHLNQEQLKKRKRDEEIQVVYEQAVDDFSKTGQVSADLQDYLEELTPQQKEFLQKVTVAQVKEKDFLNLCSFFRDKGDLEAEDIVRMANESVACFQANPSSTAIRKIREEICGFAADRKKVANALLTEARPFLASLDANERNLVKPTFEQMVAGFESEQKKAAYRPSIPSVVFAAIVSLLPLGILMACVRGTRTGLGRLVVGFIFCGAGMGYLWLAFDFVTTDLRDFHRAPLVYGGLLSILVFTGIFFLSHSYRIGKTHNSGVPIPDTVHRASELLADWRKGEADT